MKVKTLILSTLIIINTGCQTSTDYYKSVTPPAYRSVATGSQIQVNVPLTIEPGLARVHFQNGNVLVESQLNKYYPNCSLEIKTLSNNKQQIVPDRFTIIKITTFSDSHAVLHRQYASLAVADDVNSDENWLTSFYLQSGKQPDVLRLNCQHWEDPANARHVTLDEIKKVLGELITFNP